MPSPRYVDDGYWVRGYVEGDYVDAALSSDATSGTSATAGLVLLPAAVPEATSTTTFSPYRVQQAGIKSEGASATNTAARLRFSIGNLIASDSAGLIAAAKIINNTAASVSAEGIAALAARLKWEAELEPEDNWADQLEPTDIWVDSLEPSYEWTSAEEPDGIWTDRPEPSDTWSND